MPTTIDDPMFTIRVDGQRRFLDVATRGIWDQQVATRFFESVLEALKRLALHGCPPGQHLTLIDITGFVVQPQDIATMLGLMLADPRLAMQAKRVAPSNGYFPTRAEAMAWLFADEEVTPA